MPQSKDFPPPPGSDESLARWLRSNQSRYPGADCEATVLQEALATTTEAQAETQPSSGRRLGLKIVMSIVASLLLLGAGLWGQLGSQTELGSPPLARETEEHLDNKSP